MDVEELWHLEAAWLAVERSAVQGLVQADWLADAQDEKPDLVANFGRCTKKARVFVIVDGGQEFLMIAV